MSNLAGLFYYVGSGHHTKRSVTKRLSYRHLALARPILAEYIAVFRGSVDSVYSFFRTVVVGRDRRAILSDLAAFDSISRTFVGADSFLYLVGSLCSWTQHISRRNQFAFHTRGRAGLWMFSCVVALVGERKFNRILQSAFEQGVIALHMQLYRDIVRCSLPDIQFP